MLNADFSFFGDGHVEAGYISDISEILTVCIFKVK
jgi:hypothetical protein